MPDIDASNVIPPDADDISDDTPDDDSLDASIATGNFFDRDSQNDNYNHDDADDYAHVIPHEST